jgi:hypothetical protein
MNLLSNLFGKSRPSRSHTVKPTVEQLSERIVLSTASTSVHAVTDNFGTSVEFYLKDGCLNENGYGHGPQQLLTKGAATSFSAGVDQWGNADCFIREANNTFWEYYYRGSTVFTKEFFTTQNGQNVPYTNVGSFAADSEGNVFFVNGDYSVWEYSASSGYQQLDGPASNSRALDVVTNGNSACDTVFVRRYGGVFGDYTESGGSWEGPFSSFNQLSQGDPVAGGFSAGLDQWGRADVYCQDIYGQLFKWDTGAPGWQMLTGANVVKSYSATSYGQVDAIAANGTLIQFEQNDSRETLYNQTTFREISVPTLSGNMWTEGSMGAFNNLYNVDTVNNELYDFYLPNRSWHGIDIPVQ